MAKGKIIDRAMVDLVLSMKERNPALTTTQIGQVLNCDATTAGRIISCGSWEAYCEWKEEKARKEREKNRKAAEEQAEEPQREPEVPGQMKMDLTGAEQKYTTVKVQIPANEPLVLVNEQKMIRFMAGNFDAIRKNQAELFAYCTDISLKLDKLNDTLHMILRAVRKE